MYQVDGSNTTLRLSYNAVRKAADGGRNGFVSPQKLNKGISIRSVSPGTSKSKSKSKSKCESYLDV